MNKIVYKGASNLEFLQSLLVRGLFVIAIVCLIFIYEENRPVISVVILICSLFFIFIGNDEIIIYSDKFVQTNTSIARIFYKSGMVVYDLTDIQRVSLPEKEEAPGFFDIGVILMLVSLLSRSRQSRYKSKQRFYLDLKNGETVIIASSLEQSKMKEIVETINSIVYANCNECVLLCPTPVLPFFHTNSTNKGLLKQK